MESLTPEGVSYRVGQKRWWGRACGGGEIEVGCGQVRRPNAAGRGNPALLALDGYS